MKLYKMEVCWNEKEIDSFYTIASNDQEAKMKIIKWYISQDSDKKENREVFDKRLKLVSESLVKEIPEEVIAVMEYVY
jgi:hypothetical protein